MKPLDYRKDNLATKMILVVDDEEDLLEIIRSHLEDASYQVVTARDGEQGLAMAKRIKPNLIILDIAMPVMNGMEMLEHLRSEPALAQMPVVMLTAQGQTSHIMDAGRLKAVDFLIKPFSRQDLLQAVQKVL